MGGRGAGEGLGDFMLVCLLREPRGGGRGLGRTRSVCMALLLPAAARGTSLLSHEPSGRKENVLEDRAGPGTSGELWCSSRSGLRDSALCLTGFCCSGAPGAPGACPAGPRVSTWDCTTTCVTPMPFHSAGWVTDRVGTLDSLLLKSHPAWPSLITFPSLLAPLTSCDTTPSGDTTAPCDIIHPM